MFRERSKRWKKEEKEKRDRDKIGRGLREISCGLD
jgi:hypothetical protein